MDKPKTKPNPNWGGPRPGSGRKPVVKGGKPLSVRISDEQRAKLDVARGDMSEADFVRAWLESLQIDTPH